MIVSKYTCSGKWYDNSDKTLGSFSFRSCTDKTNITVYRELKKRPATTRLLVGEKVPNARDIYRFDTGDKFCYQITDSLSRCSIVIMEIWRLFLDLLYPEDTNIQVNKQTDSCRIGGPGQCKCGNGPRTSSVAVFTNLSSTCFKWKLILSR